VGGGCLVVGSACQALSDCCSGVCANDGTGFRSCEFLGGCRPENELCRRETDCCGFFAANKGTQPVCEFYSPDAGIGRCRTIAGGNAPAGEICPSTNTCAPTNDYCVDTIFGVSRCVGQCDGGVCGGGGACRGSGASCLTPDECCSQVCAPRGDGGFACSAACVGLGLSCSANADCCSGICSLNGVCVAPTPPSPDAGTDGGTQCKPISATCTNSGECCSTYCDPATRRCEPIIQ
jgi:hypothetical protein